MMRIVIKVGLKMVSLQYFITFYIVIQEQKAKKEDKNEENDMEVEEESEEEEVEEKQQVPIKAKQTQPQPQSESEEDVESLEAEENEEEEDNKRKEQEKKDQIKNTLENEISAALSKKILSLLNKLSDGNMDVIFKDLHEEIMKFSAYPETVAKVYFSVFKKFCIDAQMLNSAILSVNCLMITAFQRLLGQSFFAPIVTELYNTFIEAHKAIHATENPDNIHQTMLKNIISIFTHFYLFESITHTLISDVIKHLLRNFKEKDIEMLLNLLHNIGALLRKDSPSLCKDIILLCEAKKIEAKIGASQKAPATQPGAPKDPLKVPGQNLTPFERKVKFLTEELNDIRNNKVSRRSKLLDSLKLYLNWLKTNSQVKSELLKNPVDVNFETLEASKAGQKWWVSEEDKAEYQSGLKISEIEQKIDKSYLSQLEAAAKAQHFATDIQKSVFYTLMSSDDYLDAYQSLQKLGLKKKQERVIIQVRRGFKRYLCSH